MPACLILLRLSQKIPLSCCTVYRTKLRREGSDGGEKVVYSGKKVRKMKGNNLTSAQRQRGLQMYLANSARCECGLGHDRSPDYIAMGNYSNGRYYVTAFHLYERNNDGLKRALRRIRRDRQLCNKDFSELLRENDQSQQQPKSAARRTRTGDDNNRQPEVKERRGNGRKTPPTAAEIASRRAERQQRRLQERLAKKHMDAARPADANAELSAGDERRKEGGGDGARQTLSKEARRAARRQNNQRESANSRPDRQRKRDGRERGGAAE